MIGYKINLEDKILKIFWFSLIYIDDYIEFFVKVFIYLCPFEKYILLI